MSGVRSKSSLPEDFADDGGDLFSSPCALQAFSQFRIAVSVGQLSKESSRLFVWPLVEKWKYKTVLQLSRTAEVLLIAIGYFSSKGFLDEHPPFNEFEAV